MCIYVYMYMCICSTYMYTKLLLALRTTVISTVVSGRFLFDRALFCCFPDLVFNFL